MKMASGLFKTGMRLQVAIDNADRIDGMREYLDMCFAYLAFDLDGEAAEKALAGEWFKPVDWMLEGAIDYGTRDYDVENLMCEYVPRYIDSMQYGDVVERDGHTWEYLSSIGLSHEEEHQAEDGQFTYEYRGHSFVRVWICLSKGEK